MTYRCPYCFKTYIDEFAKCCGEVGHLDKVSAFMHQALLVDDNLPIVELVRVLSAGGLTMSNRPEGLMIHRMEAK